MSAAVTSASVKLSNGVLVSIGDASGSAENLYREMVFVLGEEEARKFMSQARAAFISEKEVYEQKSWGNKGGGGQTQSGGGSWGGRQSSPRPQGGNDKFCEHGKMTHKNFTSKAGKKVELWECSQDICDTVWPPRS